MNVFLPEGDETNRPAIVYFFGGGWLSRNFNQFNDFAKHFASMGFVCFVADYRVEKTEGTTPYDCVSDAKSAIRYVRENSKLFGINPNCIIGSGAQPAAILRQPP